MLTKFTKAGSSVAVIIPSSDLKRLGIVSKDFKKYSFDMRVNEDSKTVLLSGFVLDDESGTKPGPEQLATIPDDDEIPF